MSNKNKKQETVKAKVEPPKEVVMSPNDEALERYKVLFNKADKKRLGKISSHEVKEIMRNNLEDVDQNTLAAVGEIADNKGDITLDAFLNFIRVNFMDTEEEDVIRAFKVFDKDNNGYLTCPEFRHILTTLGDKFTDDEVEEVFREANLKGDGKLNYVEFVEFWKSK